MDEFSYLLEIDTYACRAKQNKQEDTFKIR